MHSDSHNDAALSPPWLANIPLEPGYQEAALVIVHAGRAAVPPEGLIQVLRFHADGRGGWIGAARAGHGGWGYIDGDGQWRVPPTLQHAGSFSGDGLARFCDAGRWGFVDLSGTVAIAPTFENAQPFCNGLCAVQAGTAAWHIIDRQGRTLCNEEFRDLSAFGANGLARAAPRAQATTDASTPGFGFVNATGQWVIEPQFHSARPFGDWPTTAVSLDGSSYGLIDSEGHWVLAPCYAAVDEFNADGLAFFAEHNAWENGYGYLDVQGRVVVRGGIHLSRHMACGAVAHSDHGAVFLTASGQPLPAPALSFGTDFSEEWGFAVARTAPQPVGQGSGATAVAAPEWGLLHPDGSFVPAQEHLLEPLTDGDGWLVAPQPGTPVVPFITRDGQMAYIDSEGAVVWRAHYDGQQVALLDAAGTLLWRSGVQAHCWPPRPFFNAPVTDHLEGLPSLDRIAPLAHSLLSEAQAQWHATAHNDCCQQPGALAPRGSRAGAASADATDLAQPVRTKVARRVLHAYLSGSHSGPYGFLPARIQGVVDEAQTAMVQRLTTRYGTPVAVSPGSAGPAQYDSGPTWSWNVPLEASLPAAGLGAPPAQRLTLYRHAGSDDGDTWWELWLSASPPAGSPPRAVCTDQGAPGEAEEDRARHRLTHGARRVRHAKPVPRVRAGVRGWRPAVTLLARLLQGLAALAGLRPLRKRQRRPKLRNPGSRSSV